MEIRGGYLVWLWLREGRGFVLGALGGLLLFLYGVVPTFQPAHFGRVYAACAGRGRRNDHACRSYGDSTSGAGHEVPRREKLRGALSK